LVKDLEEDKIIELGMDVAKSKNELAKNYNSMNKEERSRNRDVFSKCELLEFKMYSIRDFLWFKQGHIKFDLPKGVEYPRDYEKVTKNNGLKRILSKFRRNK
jgi:hypothetical protein